MKWIRTMVCALGMLACVSLSAFAAEYGEPNITTKTTMKELRENPSIKGSGYYTYCNEWIEGSTQYDDTPIEGYVSYAAAEDAAEGMNLVIENYNKGRKPVMNSIAEITWKAAIGVGLFQLIAAVFPGTSRSGATILGGILLGMSRTTAAEFTFFLAVPVMAGASLLKLVKFGLAFSASEAVILIVGMVVAFVVSIIVIKFLLNYIRRNDFKAFGWYRIVLGVLVILFFSL